MKTSWLRTALVAGLALGTLALVICLSPPTGESRALSADRVNGAPTASADRLVVHEWGTFTNFAGSDGVELDFRPNVEEDLPPFVFNRFRQTLSPLGKYSIRAPLRMETPVTYFYTNRPRDVHVSVKFPQGLLTEFYPPVQRMLPAYSAGSETALANSLLDWGKVRLIPAADFANMRLASGQQLQLPAVSGDDHYGFARETDAAIVRVDRYSVPHYEKFLFYRGIGKYKLPVTLEARGNDRFVVHNSGAQPVGAMFLVAIENGVVRYVPAPQLPAHGSLELQLPPAAKETPRFCSPELVTGSSLEALRSDVERALVATGLYEKEAQAMVKTWHSSWFGEEGTRLFYLVPPAETEAILPLAISPQPDELVRVLVGRIEVLTPERENALRLALMSAGTCASANAEPLRGEIERLGRFAEPTLERIARTSADDSVGPVASKLLAELKQH